VAGLAVLLLRQQPQHLDQIQYLALLPQPEAVEEEAKLRLELLERLKLVGLVVVGIMYLEQEQGLRETHQTRPHHKAIMAAMLFLQALILLEAVEVVLLRLAERQPLLPQRLATVETELPRLFLVHQ
jgi:hypothetical protein